MSLITKRDITDISSEAVYLRRWTLWLPLGWSLKLHKIMRADDDRCLHDHPWWMLRFILWGGYDEDRGDGINRRVRPWRFYYCPRNFRHRISRLCRGVSWTLALCGPSTGKWGFFTRSGWVDWRTFVDAARSLRVLWCDDGRNVGHGTETEA